MYNRRKYKRFPISAEVEFVLFGKNITVEVRDISENGISIVFNRKLIASQPHGQVWNTKIHSLDLARSINPIVSLARVKEIRGTQLIGLEFQSITDDDIKIIKAYKALFLSREKRTVRKSIQDYIAS